MLSFDQELSRSERQIVARLTTPSKIKGFLDESGYSIAETNRCPLYVLRERMANCFDGAVFAAALLSRLGFPPLILDMLPNDRDDDHVLALYNISTPGIGGRWPSQILPACDSANQFTAP